MKKHYSLLCTLLAAAMAMPVAAQNAGVSAKAKSETVAAADDSKHMTVLIDEDFSGFTDGTEDNPSDVNLVDDMGDFTNPSALKPYSSALSYKKWGGEGLYSAGGCLAIKDEWFLNTPAGDMSGNIKLTFRARLVKGSGQIINALRLMFISRASLLDYETKNLTLNEDWQTFTYTSNRGEFESSGFQFYSNTEATILIDDIRLEKVQTSIAAPEVKDAEDVTDTSFKAVWEPTSEADHYLLNVYSKTENEDYVTVAEGFDNISADDEGNINVDAPSYPEGWSIGWADINGKKRVVSGAGSGTGNKQALRFSENEDYITTPRYEDGIKTFKVWLKGEQNSDEVGFGNAIQFTFDTDYGLQDVSSIDMKGLFTPDKINGYYCDLTKAIEDFGVKVYAIKMWFIRDEFENDPTTLLVDDISLSYKAPATLNYALKEQRVEKPTSEEDETVSFNVTGLDPDTDYYYSVKAVNSEFTSAFSDEKEVYAVSQPTALPATDVTTDSYTANWTSHNKVDFYRVDQVQQTTLDKDVKDYEVLYEDFSKVTSDLTEQDLIDYYAYDQDEPTSGYMPIDDYTQIAGWKASSPIKINGWLGGNQAIESGKIAGAIVTPTLDLSNNDGSCNISVRAWGSTGDWLIIQGSNPASQGTIEFPEDGFVETTINMPLCTSKEQLTFYSNNYYPFLIDYIKITQDVKAGDKVTTVTGAVTTEDETTKSVVMTNPNFSADHEIYYKVTAMRYDIDSQESHKYYITSNPSELIHVKNPTTGIRSTDTVAESVKGTNGGIVVNVAEAATANVYNMAGQLAATKACGNGHTFIGVAPGVYVVKTAHTTAKVVVK